MAEERSAALGRELEVLREARESPEMVEEEPESSESLTPLTPPPSLGPTT
jgi:hypothetical protein